jgi:hypothetical protein
MTRLRPRLPHWTSSPGFGVAVLLVLAVILIAHGEPQPSSRPSGTSVGVSGSPTAPAVVPALLVIRAGVVEARQSHSVRRVPLPAGARPLSVVTGRGICVVLAALDGRQRAYAVQPNLAVRDLGPADAVIPAATPTAAVLVETGLTEPGRLIGGASAGATATASRTASASPSPTGPPDLRDFVVRRYDSSGRPVGGYRFLPAGTRMATDTAVGLVVWKPVNRVFDNGVALEPLSAAAILIRPDSSLRQLGPVHPLAADDTNLLVWDVAVRRFGVMPLRYATSTATSTATPSASSSRPQSGSPPAGTGSASSSPSATATTVAGVRWFSPIRGITVVTGPASFAPDGSAFAVYSQVGSRRRLVVGQLQNLGTDRVEVLALVQPAAPSSQPVRSIAPGPSGQPGSGVTVTGSSSVGVTGSAAGSASSGSASASSTSKSASPSIPALQPDGFPIPAPLSPLWWDGQVVALGPDGVVVGYRPGTNQASLLDLGAHDLQAIAELP